MSDEKTSRDQNLESEPQKPIAFVSRHLIESLLQGGQMGVSAILYSDGDLGDKNLVALYRQPPTLKNISAQEALEVAAATLHVAVDKIPNPNWYIRFANAIISFARRKG